MKRNKHILTAGILPFVAALPLPAAADSAPSGFDITAERVSISAGRMIAGFPTLSSSLLGTAPGAKTPKKCTKSPSKPTKKPCVP